MNEATQYWAQFLQQYPNAELYEAFSFAHTKELADELGSYVVNGTKTATCSAQVLYDKLGDPLPQHGEAFSDDMLLVCERFKRVK
ncbi:MAG: hypothetical protein UHX00_05640 [Caryophanon sp.]|nr:hypothetical protein [Caryophanon sp.]